MLNLNRILYVLPLCLFSALPHAVATSTVSGDPIPMHCEHVSKKEAQHNIGLLTSHLRVASSVGHIKDMKTFKGELDEFLETCSSDQKRHMLCNHRCYMERARVNLFNASYLPIINVELLLNQGVQAKTLAKEAERGLALLDEAKEAIRLRESDEDFDLEGYLQEHIELALLEIRLLLTAGDIWYQEHTQGAIKALFRDLTETLQPLQGRDEADFLAKARNYYDHAFTVWFENDALVTDKANHIHLRNELAQIRREMNQRRNSIQNGLLYLNLDPKKRVELSTLGLMSHLSDLNGKLKNLENEIQNKIVRGVQSSQVEKKENDERMRRYWNDNVAERSYRIGLLEAEGYAFRNQVETSLAQLDRQSDTTQLLTSKAQVEFDLRQKLLMSQFRQRDYDKHLDELDLLEGQRKLSKNLGDLRWLIQQETSKHGFALQKDSFNEQYDEYSRQDKANTTRFNKIGIDLQTLDLKLKISEQEVERLNFQKEEYAWKQTMLTGFRQTGLESAVCQIEMQLAFLGYEIKGGQCREQYEGPQLSLAEYHKEVAEIRDDLLDREITLEDFMTRCVLDSPLEGYEGAPANCNDIPRSRVALAKSIFERHLAIVKSSQQTINQSIAKIKEMQEFSKNSFASHAKRTRDFISEDWQSKFAVSAAQVLVNEALATSTNFVPAGYTTVGIIGENAAAKTTSRLIQSNIANTIVQLRSMARSQEIQLEREDDQNVSQNKHYELQILYALGSLDELEGQKNLKELALLQTELEIGESRYAHTKHYQDLKSQFRLLHLEKDFNESDLKKQIQNLQLERDKLLGQISVNEIEVEKVIKAQIDQLDTRVMQEQYQQKIYGLERESLDLQKRAIDDDKDDLRKLKASVMGKIAKIDEFISQLDKHEDELGEKDQRLQEIEDQINATKRWFLKNTFDYNDELGSSEQKLDEDKFKALKILLEQNGIRKELQDALYDNQKTVLQKVKDERQAIIKNVERQREDEKKKEEEGYVVLTEEMLSLLTTSMPAYLRQKKNLLVEINQALVILANRHNEKLKGASIVPELLEITPVLSSQQLEEQLALIKPYQGFESFTASIHLTRDTPFVQELLEKGHIAFNLSPSGREANPPGYKTIWFTPDQNNQDPISVSRNARLLKADLIFTGCSSLHTAKARLIHKGSGWTFLPNRDGTYVPQLEVVGERSEVIKPRLILDPTDARVDDAKTSAVANERFNLENEHYHGDLFGVPLVASYELILDYVPCDSSDLQIRFYYSGQ
ncbi:MAG: hypothetical protein HYW48_07865 [Deltaproteobacteria bacterium]|nr:hypothetical protein [Deltaproteobacteria bacterium]